MTAPVHPTPDLRDRLRRVLAKADGFTFEHLEPHDYQGHVDAVLGIVQPELDVKQAEISRLIGFIERGFDTHMQFGVIGADGVTTMQPCADWCYACKLDLAQEAASQRADMLEEARDLLSNAGHNRAHVDDWPDIIPALRDLVAERDQLRTVARAAAALLRATADRPSNRAALLAAARAIDELTTKET